MPDGVGSPRRTRLLTPLVAPTVYTCLHWYIEYQNTFLDQPIAARLELLSANRNVVLSCTSSAESDFQASSRGHRSPVVPGGDQYLRHFPPCPIQNLCDFPRLSRKVIRNFVKSVV